MILLKLGLKGRRSFGIRRISSSSVALDPTLGPLQENSDGTFRRTSTLEDDGRNSIQKYIFFSSEHKRGQLRASSPDRASILSPGEPFAVRHSSHGRGEIVPSLSHSQPDRLPRKTTFSGKLLYKSAPLFPSDPVNPATDRSKIAEYDSITTMRAGALSTARLHMNMNSLGSMS